MIHATLFTCEQVYVSLVFTYEHCDDGDAVSPNGRKNRCLKVVKSFSNKPKASLCLKGRWLEQAGFTIDMRVEVIVKENYLIIIPSKAGK
jgi:Toxin SymE, type I toxin-antitoxin system